MKKSKVFRGHYRHLVLDYLLWCIHKIWLDQTVIGVNNLFDHPRISSENSVFEFLEIVDIHSYLTQVMLK